MATIQTDFYRANPLRSMTEYTADLDAQDLRQQQLQQNSLALQGAKLGFEDRNRVMAEQAQIRNALSGLGPGATDEQVFSRIRSLGTPTALAASDAIMKTALERQKAGAAAGKDTEETAAKRVKLYRDQLDVINTPEQAAQWMVAQHKDPVIGQIMQQMMPLDQALQHLPQDPAQFQQWRQQAALGMEKFITNQTTQRGQDITSQTQLATNAATNARVAAEGAANRQVTREGQTLTDQRARELAAAKVDNKPLTPAATKTITEARDNAATIDRLSESFKPEYAGKGVLGVGADAQLAASGNLGVDKDSVDWWKNYRKQAELIERHALFGAALTPTEQASWRSADIGPGMDADVVKRNLATRAVLAKKVFENTQQDLIDAGHNPDRINALSSRNTKVETPKGVRKVVRTGTSNGRKVVEYSDGTISYAD